MLRLEVLGSVDFPRHPRVIEVNLGTFDPLQKKMNQEPFGREESFYDYQLPMAIIRLSKLDHTSVGQRSAVLILDSRISKRYGKQVNRVFEMKQSSESLAEQIYINVQEFLNK